MSKQKNMDFDEMMVLKEKRRNSRENQKKHTDFDRVGVKKVKHKKSKHIDYDPNYDYDEYDYTNDMT